MGRIRINKNVAYCVLCKKSKPYCNIYSGLLIGSVHSKCYDKYIRNIQNGKNKSKRKKVK